MALSVFPSGTITFLFTDIEGSTQRWDHGPRAMTTALARHDAILRQAVEAHGGHVFKTVGDAFCVAFPVAVHALEAAVAVQHALTDESWGEVDFLRVRIAMHTGAADERDGDYFGPPLNRVARLLGAGHGGQILLSRATQELVRDVLPIDLTLRDLGEHRLRDLQHPERIFQLVVPGLMADFPPLRTLDTLLHNLPAHPTPLIGREGEIATTCDLLQSPDTRLVTLSGPGGAGKTRLALHLAAAMATDFADGVYFISLAPLTDPDLVLPEIAATVDVRDTGGQSLRDSLRAELQLRHLLLVLDNFEHVTAAAEIVADLLAGCPRLNVLVTSRTLLHLRGEREVPVPSLSMPERTSRIGEAGPRLPPIEQLIEYEAVRLFAERAQAVKPDFVITRDNADAVVEICARLDGLPLAIELAAARVRMLPPAAMLTRLVHRLDLLASGPRDLPSRQQTMRATIAWSYGLLAPQESRLFARLSIFVGGFTLDAATAVAGEVEGLSGEARSDPLLSSALSAPADTLELVSSLLDKSLIRIVDEEEVEPRLGMLETIREFGLECLMTSGETEAIGQRHAETYLALAEAAAPHLEGPEQRRWLDRLDRDHANLRAALARFSEHGEASRALRLGGALWRFWWLRGHFTDGRAQLEDVLQLPTDSSWAAIRAKALNGAGVLADAQGDYDRAAALHEESLKITREVGDKQELAWTLNNLGWVAWHQGQYGRAAALLEENLAIAKAADHKPGIARAMTDLGSVAYHQANYERAKSAYQTGVTLFRELGDDAQVARSLSNLAAIELDQGRTDGVDTLLNEALILQRAVGDKQGIAQTLNNLAELACRQGDDERAVALYEESCVLAQETGDKHSAAIALANLAGPAQRRGDHARARSLYKEALALYRIVGDWLGTRACLVGLAKVAASQGQAESAAWLLGVTAALCAAHNLQDPGSDPNDELDVVTRATLGMDAFPLAWAAGQTMPLEQAIAEVLASVP